MYQIIVFSNNQPPSFYNCTGARNLIYQLQWIKENMVLAEKLVIYNIDDRDQAMIPLMSLDMKS